MAYINKLSKQINRFIIFILQKINTQDHYFICLLVLLLVLLPPNNVIKCYSFACHPQNPCTKEYYIIIASNTLIRLVYYPIILLSICLMDSSQFPISRFQPVQSVKQKILDRLYIHVVDRLFIWDADNNKVITASSHSQSF